MAVYERTRDDKPNNWFKNVEMAKERAYGMMKKVAAIHQTNSVIVGKVTGAEIDKLFNANYQYCKITMEKAFRFSTEGNLEAKLGNDGVFWVNTPEHIMTVDELSRRFPKVYMEILPNIKKNVW
jgi:hypothetical protein